MSDDKPGFRRRLTVKLAKLRGEHPPLHPTSDYFPEHRIGRATYGRPRIFSYPNDAGLTIGAFCSIAEGVAIFLGGEHHPEWVSTYPFGALWPEHEHPEQPKSRGDVVIGNDVWIGREAMIMSGVTVGDGAVIGARALVAKDVPPYGIVGGNPAKLIRQRFPDDIVARLLALRWWDWPDERIRKAGAMLQSPDIAAFLDAAEAGRV